MYTVNTQRDPLAVRSGPGTKFRKINDLAKGSRVTIVERSPDGAPWAYVIGGVQTNPVSGWVHTDYLKASNSTTWRLAESLRKLRGQIRNRWPNTNTKYDGSIGDLAHSKRKSDHNPDENNVVKALDITDDDDDADMDALSEKLRGSRDPRIKYVIFKERMFSSYVSGGVPAWTWRRYTGGNGHIHHMHISVVSDPALYDDDSPWIF